MKQVMKDGHVATTMKALVYLGPGKRAWQERPRPKITAPHDAIVRITTTTICGSDLHILKGDVPTAASGLVLAYSTHADQGFHAKPIRISSESGHHGGLKQPYPSFPFLSVFGRRDGPVSLTF